MAQFTTRFNVGDTIVTLDEKTRKAIEVKIGYVSVTTTKEKSSVKYSPVKETGEVDYYTSYDETICFKTKDQLIDYICN